MKLLYLWFRINSKSACEARGKLARWITRNVKTSVEDTLNEMYDEELNGMLSDNGRDWII